MSAVAGDAGEQTTLISTDADADVAAPIKFSLMHVRCSLSGIFELQRSLRDCGDRAVPLFRVADLLGTSHQHRGLAIA